MNGAVFKARNESGVDAIVRDVNGMVVAALSKKIHAPLGPLEVEAKAFELGLEFAKMLDYRNLFWKVTLLMWFVPFKECRLLQFW